MKRGFALRFCYGAKGVEKHGENSQIIGGGRRSDAAGGRDFRVYAAMDLRAHGIPPRVSEKQRGPVPYQIAVCDYYGQYFASPAANRHIYLRQAQHATRLLRSAF